jgi:uncharacterized protein YbjT (DUF2867 family)
MHGSEICKRLAAEGKDARVMARASSDPAKLNALRALGLDVVQADLRDRASLVKACSGVEMVIDTASSMPFSYQPGTNDIEAVDLRGARSLIDAAREAHVRHFVYTSFAGGIDLEFPLRNAKRAVERHLQASGMTYTILRPSYFMEVWLSPAVGFDAVNAKATLYGDGRKSVSFVTIADVADFAVASLYNLAARNAILELGGPEALSPLEVVSAFERASGRVFETQLVPAEALAVQQSGATDPMQQSFIGLMRCYANGNAIEMSNTLKAFPTRLVSIAEYAAHVVVGA